MEKEKVAADELKYVKFAQKLFSTVKIKGIKKLTEIISVLHPQCLVNPAFI